MNVLIVQTAFLGDVILTIPLAEALREARPGVSVDMLVTPLAATLLAGHRDIRFVLTYDKNGAERGIGPLIRLGRSLRRRRYDAVLSPHKSLRSCLLVAMTGADTRVGFRDAAIAPVFSSRIAFDRTAHEADRNLAMLRGLDIDPPRKFQPRLYPSSDDVALVDRLVAPLETSPERWVGIAPGSVWYTKRWPAASYAALVRLLDEQGFVSLLLGGKGDADLCRDIVRTSGSARARSLAGDLTLLQSAEVIRRCRVLVTNDSAPLHIAGAMGTRVVALFGPTVPSFGFAPFGPGDSVLQVEGLSCRPCTKHGGPSCPIGTFECMLTISPAQVADAVGA